MLKVSVCHCRRAEGHFPVKSKPACSLLVAGFYGVDLYNLRGRAPQTGYGKPSIRAIIRMVDGHVLIRPIGSPIIRGAYARAFGRCGAAPLFFGEPVAGHVESVLRLQPRRELPTGGELLVRTGYLPLESYPTFQNMFASCPCVMLVTLSTL